MCEMRFVRSCLIEGRHGYALFPAGGHANALGTQKARRMPAVHASRMSATSRCTSYATSVATHADWSARWLAARTPTFGARSTSHRCRGAAVPTVRPARTFAALQGHQGSGNQSQLIRVMVDLEAVSG